MNQSNWIASGKPQTKSKKTPRRHQAWLAAHKLLVAELKKGINQDPARDGGVFCLWRFIRVLGM